MKKVVWPAQRDVASALLLVISSHGDKVSFKESKVAILKSLADYFQLTQRQRRLKHRTAGTVWSNRVQWAKMSLVSEGYFVLDSPRGVWELVGTKKPKKVA